MIFLVGDYVCLVLLLWSSLMEFDVSLYRVLFGLVVRMWKFFLLVSEIGDQDWVLLLFWMILRLGELSLGVVVCLGCLDVMRVFLMVVRFIVLKLVFWMWLLILLLSVVVQILLWVLMRQLFLVGLGMIVWICLMVVVWLCLVVGLMGVVYLVSVMLVVSVIVIVSVVWCC